MLEEGTDNPKDDVGPTVIEGAQMTQAEDIHGHGLRIPAGGKGEVVQAVACLHSIWQPH